MTAKTPPKPGKDVIYVDVDDEITGIIDKVENADQKVVALVLPKRAASLQSIVNMKLLARSADTASKNVVLITSEAALIPLAGVAGLHVAKNLQTAPEVPDAPLGAAVAVAGGALAAHKLKGDEESDEAEQLDPDDLPEKIDYNNSIGELTEAHDEDGSDAIDLDDEDEADKPKPKAAKKPKEKKVKVPNFDRFRMLLGLGILALVAFVVFIILAIFVLPKAKITIQTTSEPVTANFNLTASASTTAPDSAKSVIPAKLESMDQTGNQSVTATGQQNNGQKATGDLTFSIPCSAVSGSPPTIPAGTGVTTNGLGYITQSSASLTTPHFSPCTFTGSTTIVSAGVGSKYNIGTSTFAISGSGYTSVTASGSASGGTDSIVTVLSQADVDGAKQKITGGTTGSDFTKAFEDKLAAQGEYVLTSTMKASDPVISATPAVGQPASTANVSIKTTYTVLTVKKTDLTQLISDKMAGQIDKTKQKLSGDLFNDANITVQSQSAPNAAVLGINVDTTAVPIIDVAVVKKQAAGKKVGDIQTVINNWPGVKNVNVSLSPFWVSKVPSKTGKITVVLQEVKSTSSNNNSAP